VISRLKYDGCRWLAGVAAGLLLEHCCCLPGKSDCIVPLPLSRSRFRERGFNQSALIARALCRRTGSRYMDLLGRREGSPPQVGLPAARRRTNVRNVYFVRRKPPQGMRVWLLDDVMTTGSSIDSASSVIRARCGVAPVAAVTVTYRPMASYP
jgi:ComF family protein